MPNRHALPVSASRTVVAFNPGSPDGRRWMEATAAERNPVAADPAFPKPRVDELLLRMRAGDRDAAGAFVMQYGPRIRRRVRGKLAPSMRRLYDSMDILSTLGRRLDDYVMHGRMQAADELELWKLVFAIADHAVVDKARMYASLSLYEGADSEFAQQLLRRLRVAETERNSGAEFEIEQCLRRLQDPDDRRMLSMWLTGETMVAIAETLEILPAAARKRWEKIKATLRMHLQSTGIPIEQ